MNFEENNVVITHAGSLSHKLPSTYYANGVYRHKFTSVVNTCIKPTLTPGDIVIARVVAIINKNAVVIVEKCINKNFLITKKMILPISAISKKYVEGFNGYIHLKDVIIAEIKDTDAVTTVLPTCGVVLTYCQKCRAAIYIRTPSDVCIHCETINPRKYSNTFGVQYSIC